MSTNEVTKADIDALIANKISESISIEYKEGLSIGTSGQNKEFLADICSFANSSGGTIYFGIKDLRKDGNATGIPSSAEGLQDTDDNTLGRISQIIAAGISPRLRGVKTYAVHGFPSGPVIAIQIPRSWNGPHAVWLEENSKFWARDAQRKFQLNVDQIRSFILASDSTSKRIRDFRLERLAKIDSGDGPVVLAKGSRLTLHLVPVSSVNSNESWSIKDLQNAAGETFKPLSNAIGFQNRVNLDGLLIHSGNSNSKERISYAQLFRNGTIEACDVATIESLGNPTRIHMLKLQTTLIKGLGKFLKTLSNLGVSLPVCLMVSIEGVRGKELIYSARPDYFPGIDHAIDRDRLLMGEVLVEDFNESSDKILRPLFDSIYNAAGYEECPHYDSSGRHSEEFFHRPV